MEAVKEDKPKWTYMVIFINSTEEWPLNGVEWKQKIYVVDPNFQD